MPTLDDEFIEACDDILELYYAIELTNMEESLGVPWDGREESILGTHIFYSLYRIAKYIDYSEV